MVADLYKRSNNEELNRPSRTTIIESLTTSAWDYEYGTRLVKPFAHSHTMTIHVGF